MTFPYHHLLGRLATVRVAAVALAWSFWPGPASAAINSHVNVSNYCNVNGQDDNSNCIRQAIEVVRSAGGGIVYFPCGNYRTTSSINIPTGLIGLQGDGRCTRWAAEGNYDTINSNVGGSNLFYGNSIKGIYFVENQKSGGYTIRADHWNQADLADVTIDAPMCGPNLHNFNDISVRRVRIANTRQQGCQAFLLSGGSSSDPNGRSDVIDFEDVVISNDIPIGNRTGQFNGLIVEGNVNTLSAHKIYFTAVDGHALWFRNNGASNGPAFASIYGLEADFPTETAIYLQSGSTFHFTDTQVNGSQRNHNIFIRPEVTRVSFEGGFTSGASKSGIDIFGSQVTVSNMDITANSSPDNGGSAGAWSGLVVEDPARAVSINGNKVGTPQHSDWQRYGIQINNGADQYSVTGNVVFNNAAGAILGNSGSASRVITANGQ